MTNPVMILNTDKHIKAVILCDRLVLTGITHMYELVGIQHTVTVSESDVQKALGDLK